MLVLSSLLEVQGYSEASVAKTGAYTLTASDSCVLAGGTGAYTVTLPSASSTAALGQNFTIINTCSAAGDKITIATTSSQTINGATTFVLPNPNTYLEVQSNGSNWVIIDANTGVWPGNISPLPVALTDATTIAVDASLGNHFRVTLGASRTMGVPSNPTDGQKILFEITQPGSGGPYTITWASSTGGYVWGTDVIVPTLSTAASKADYIGFVYNTTANVWRGLAVSRGY